MAKYSILVLGCIFFLATLVRAGVWRNKRFVIPYNPDDLNGFNPDGPDVWKRWNALKKHGTLHALVDLFGAFNIAEYYSRIAVLASKAKERIDNEERSYEYGFESDGVRKKRECNGCAEEQGNLNFRDSQDNIFGYDFAHDSRKRRETLKIKRDNSPFGGPKGEAEEKTFGKDFPYNSPEDLTFSKDFPYNSQKKRETLKKKRDNSPFGGPKGEAEEKTFGKDFPYNSPEDLTFSKDFPYKSSKKREAVRNKRECIDCTEEKENFYFRDNYPFDSPVDDNSFGNDFPFNSPNKPGNNPFGNDFPYNSPKNEAFGNEFPYSNPRPIQKPNPKNGIDPLYSLLANLARSVFRSEEAAKFFEKYKGRQRYDELF